MENIFEFAYHSQSSSTFSKSEKLDKSPIRSFVIFSFFHLFEFLIRHSLESRVQSLLSAAYLPIVFAVGECIGKIMETRETAMEP